MAASALNDSARRHERSAFAVRSLVVPCTRTKGSRVCRLFQHLSSCNSLLWYLGVQLRELDDAELGNLQVVTIREIHYTSYSSVSDEAEWIAADFLESLLNSHKCIAGIELNCVIANNVSLLKAVKNAPSLRRVRVNGTLNFQEKALQSMCTTMRLLDNIEHLELPTPSTYPLHQILLSVLDLLQPGTSLTSLDVAQLQENNLYTRMLTDALMQNSTITKLVIGAYIFSSGLKGAAHKFAEYLTKKNSTLKKLTMRAHHSLDRDGFKLVVRAIPHASMLEELVADLSLMEPEEMALFAEVVERSQSVRIFSVTRSKCCERFMTPYLDELMLCRGRADLMLPWLSALPKNTTLLKLEIDLQGFGVNEICDFFRAVAMNNTLQLVIVRNITLGNGLREVFGLIGTCGLSRKVFVDDLHVRPLNIPDLPECPFVTTVTLSYNHIERLEVFRSAFRVLLNCPHVTSLSIHTMSDLYDYNVQSDIAAYIRAASTLKHFKLRLCTAFRGFFQPDEVSENCLIDVLASNVNLHTITLNMPFSEKGFQSLAFYALQMPKLNQLSLADSDWCFNGAFYCSLVPGIEMNYSLLRVELPECEGYEAEKVTVQDVTRRNCCLVARAARFVMGDQDPFCASALEIVSGHAKLVEIVQSKAGVETSEAIAMIKRALASIRGLDEYMKLSGVVQHRVDCIKQQDGGTQLVDLNEYCWLHIRKYLTLEDVVNT
ncbi:hypothetical protein HPB49_018380 [Dermacentor silvarum]|uniref:Uncharacterized protein n=1 Tax=Dermacentor silvarum TaxID=543639 RepID=A0ACB8DF76_DERSI|nr:hypothetical protein HPB49_018380 [Dermacentor silvarum]